MEPNNQGWIEVRSTDGRLLFRFHPGKNLIEQKKGPTVHVVDLDDRTVTERPSKPDKYRRTQYGQNLGQLAY